MACSDWVDGVEALQNYAFHDAVACFYTDSAGTAATGMLTFGAVSLAYYIRTGGITMPVVLTLIMGSILLPLMPGAATQFAGIILLFAIGIGPILLLKTISR